MIQRAVKKFMFLQIYILELSHAIVEGVINNIFVCLLQTKKNTHDMDTNPN